MWSPFSLRTTCSMVDEGVDMRKMSTPVSALILEVILVRTGGGRRREQPCQRHGCGDILHLHVLDGVPGRWQAHTDGVEVFLRNGEQLVEKIVLFCRIRT